MTNYYRRPQMQWSGATGGIVRGKRVSTEYARKSGSGRVLRSTCGEKLKPKDGTRPSKPCMRRAQDKNNPASLLQSQFCSPPRSLIKPSKLKRGVIPIDCIG